MGAKLFIRIPKHPILLNCMIGSHENHCNFIYSKWIYFDDIIFVFKETPLNMLIFFVALPPKSTAMFIAGRSVHLTTPFPGQA